MQFQFSNDVAKLQPSAIREILKFTSMPGGDFRLQQGTLLRKHFQLN